MNKRKIVIRVIIGVALVFAVMLGIHLASTTDLGALVKSLHGKP